MGYRRTGNDALCMTKLTGGTTCEQCGDKFIPTNKRGMVPKFCSNACKQRSYRQSKLDAGATTVNDEQLQRELALAGITVQDQRQLQNYRSWWMDIHKS